AAGPWRCTVYVVQDNLQPALELISRFAMWRYEMPDLKGGSPDVLWLQVTVRPFCAIQIAQALPVKVPVEKAAAAESGAMLGGAPPSWSGEQVVTELGGNTFPLRCVVGENWQGGWRTKAGMELAAREPGATYEWTPRPKGQGKHYSSRTASQGKRQRALADLRSE
ncbi:unnamed protein product, partial [Effrenium voratum]